MFAQSRAQHAPHRPLALPPLILRHGADAATRHVDEGGGVGAGVQTGLDAAQHIVGLEDEQQLARHAVEDVTDLQQVVAHLRLDLRALQRTRTFEDVNTTANNYENNIG